MSRTQILQDGVQYVIQQKFTHKCCENISHCSMTLCPKRSEMIVDYNMRVPQCVSWTRPGDTAKRHGYEQCTDGKYECASANLVAGEKCN